jgi:beta-N-acetylhexosaminidase
MLRRAFFLCLLAGLLSLSANDNLPFNLGHSLDFKEAHWVDSVFNSLSESERIAQLMVIRAHADRDPAYEQEVENLVRQYKVGGLCFFNPTHVGTVEKQAELTNRYQLASRIPLLMTIDGEWGLGMRLRETTISYPKQMMLGAIEDNRLIYKMGREIARQCRRVGIHFNFAPDADINNNPANPVINERSFGEDRYNVSAKCFQYMQGLQDGNVLASAKHFPGHGDTNVDSHYDLPQINHPIARLDSLELYPFRILTQYGVGSVMVAHLNVPALDARPNRPTTLSATVITELLRKRFGYEGLICTDAMEMKGVAKYFKDGEADAEALRAGNDLILLPGSVSAGIQAIQKGIQEGTIEQAKMYESVRRVLRAKYRLGLTKPQQVDLKNLRQDLNTPAAQVIKRQLTAKALTLVRDRDNVAGFPNLEQHRLASLSLGDTVLTVFQKNCSFFAPIRHFNASKNITAQTEQALLDSLRRYNTVLVSLHDMVSKASSNFGLTESQINFLRRLNDVTRVVITVFGNPYSLRYFEYAPTLLEAYNEDPMTQELAAQALFGAIDIEGKLPVTVSSQTRFGQGIIKKHTTHRLGYDLPEAVGMRTDSLARMDALIQEIINTGAAPGCQVLVAKDNKIVWHRAYGFHTYEQLEPVTLNSMFDLASITKVAATTVSAMRLFDERKFDLKTPAAQYIPELKGTNKQDITFEEILIHQAGLQAWIAFYEKTLTPNKTPSPAIYRQQMAQGYEMPIARNLYMQRAYQDSMWQILFKSDLRANKNYKYSDLGLFLTARTINNLSGKPVDMFATDYFYRPMGLSTMMYNPWQKGLANRCVPTEEDSYFRYQRLQGYVHDMGAAMLGGVSGHAGLFSNANDLAKMFQMLLNGGQYFGKTYLQPETVRYFTTRHPKSTRRGIGFDMKETDPKEPQNLAPLASINTFGHTGFTGNAVWADPDKKLIFIFLSNRTYPSMNNNKLISGDYRPRLQQMVYNALSQVQ